MNTFNSSISIKELEKSAQIHIITLVIKRHRDIPLVRTKAKILAEICGFDKIRRAQIALIASELARITMKRAKNGLVSFFVVCQQDSSSNLNATGLLMEFKSRSGKGLFSQDSKHDKHLLTQLGKVPDAFDAQETSGQITATKALFLGGKTSCSKFEHGTSFLKQKLFADAEESYIENLRAKHEEVLELLKTISIKNQELDKVNAELVELSRDMESLVHERTVVELALKIADRIRNPATVIGGLARILLKKMPKDSKWRPKIEAIFAEAKKLEDIVKDFEGLAKEQENFFSEIDLVELVKELIQAWQPSFEKLKVRPLLKLPEKPIMIFGNPRTLKVALLHILKNALDVSKKDSLIEIQVSRIDGKPTVIIRDFGPGIPEEVKNKLFKELVTTKPSGTGVGLIMVHHIMTEHQGRIEIESHKGIGTTVKLIFPSRWKEQ